MVSSVRCAGYNKLLKSQMVVQSKDPSHTLFALWKMMQFLELCFCNRNKLVSAEEERPVLTMWYPPPPFFFFFFFFSFFFFFFSFLLSGCCEFEVALNVSSTYSTQPPIHHHVNHSSSWCFSANNFHVCSAKKCQPLSLSLSLSHTHTHAHTHTNR